MSESILVIPGSGAVTPTDRGLLYGEGVFETLHLRPSGPWLLDRHLDRLHRSAALLELPPPPRAELAELAGRAARSWRDGEGALRLIVTAGPAGGRPATYATVGPIPPAALRERHEGIRVITADLGVRARPPWSLAAAKTLSYAENLAARRWAVRQGADDLLWLDPDGHALEAPTASLVWLTGDTLCTVPPEPTGILPGTTAAELLDRAPALGLRAEERMITTGGLAAADAVWLASSLRGLAEVRTLDGAPRAGSPWTRRLLALLGFV
ncbi:aminotransferase class IV [Amorphoplanes digitatis]|uniref:4-amino-4-deoxychorismate lyase n=1 Tax=Actinoplanes digitatis TaxID=1868 RepID=A0A7W7HRS4_9ACTN|nr:aminotransferase class IV [Actinoplanes digitatis]MBB4759612.1 4-amino-4-deoxychorismate lyase [Actinoplanes digitatis]GID96895.1 putative aminotransferase, class IV [Actinoplanes digitatis]